MPDRRIRRREVLAGLVGAGAAGLAGPGSSRPSALRVGIVDVPMDELPVIGALPGRTDIYVAVTHSGVTLAPIIGRLTTEEVLNGSRAAILAPYRPERFGA